MAKTSGLHVFVSVTALHANLTWSFAIRGFVHQNNVESVTTVARGMCVCVCVCGGGGGWGVEILQMGAKIKTLKNP